MSHTSLFRRRSDEPSRPGQAPNLRASHFVELRGTSWNFGGLQARALTFHTQKHGRLSSVRVKEGALHG